MFKKIIAIILIFCLSLSLCGFKSSEKTEVTADTPEAKIAQSVLQYPETNEDFRYDVYTYYIKITECLTTKSNVVIPDTIKNLPVYIIANDAFKNQTAITSVTMTNNIIEIGSNAFADCANLESINISTNIQTIGSGAFAGCDNIKSITIPGNLAVITESMFWGCDRLTAVIIEENEKEVVNEDGETTTVARTIAAGAFANCPVLKSVWVPMDITTIEDSAFSASMEELTIYGYAQSAAAHYASEKLLDFVVLNESDFKDIMAAATRIETINLGESLNSDLFKISFHSAFVLRGQFDYTAGGFLEKTKKLTADDELIILCFSVKNLSPTELYLNCLDISTAVNDYNAKISTYGQFSLNQLSAFNKPLLGDIPSGETMYGYIAIETTSDWKNVAVQFNNNTKLEGYAFELNSDNKNITYIGSAETPQNVVEPNEPITESTAEPSVSEETTATDNVSTTEPISTPVTENTTVAG